MTGHLRMLSVTACLVVLASSASTGKAQESAGLTGASLVPAETLFFMRVPSGEKLLTLFLDGHEASMKESAIQKMNRASSKNPVLRNRPSIKAAPGSQDTIKALGALGSGELVVAMLPNDGGELRYVAAVTGLVQDASAKFRAVTSAAAGMKWKQSDDPKSVWFSEVEGIGKIQMVERSGYLIVATAAEAIPFALEVEPGDIRALEALPLYRRSLDDPGSDTLIAYFSNFAKARPWLRSSAEDEDMASLGKLLGGRMKALEGVSWKWSSEGPGSIGRDDFTFFLSESTGNPLEEVAENPSPVPPQLISEETLGYVHLSVRLEKLAEIPVLEDLPIRRALLFLAHLKGADGATYVVDADTKPNKAFRGWILDTGGVASDWVGENLARRIGGKRLLEKDAGAIRLTMPVGNLKWYVKTTGQWLVVAADKASAKHFSEKAAKQVSPEISVAEWLKPEPPKDFANPILEVRINRPAIMRRAFQYATENYEALAAQLRADGFSLPDVSPDFEKLLRFYGPLAWWIGSESEGGALTLANAVALQDSGSTFLTTTSVVTSFLCEKPLLQTMQAWEAAFESNTGKASQSGANLFDAVAWSSVLISPLITEGNGPTLFVDFAVLNELCDIEETPESSETEVTD